MHVLACISCQDTLQYNYRYHHIHMLWLYVCMYVCMYVRMNAVHIIMYIRMYECYNFGKDILFLRNVLFY